MSELLRTGKWFLRDNKDLRNPDSVRAGIPYEIVHDAHGVVQDVYDLELGQSALKSLIVLEYLDMDYTDMPPTLKKSIDNVSPLGFEISTLAKVVDAWLNRGERELSPDEVAAIEVEDW